MMTIPKIKLLTPILKAGERVNQQEKVDVVLSKGPEKINMPNVIGIKKKML